jgi:glutamyl-tRNA reductase
LIGIKSRRGAFDCNSAMQSLRRPLPPEEARREELARALRRLAAGAEPQHVLDEMSRRLANKLLHVPTVALE